MSPLPGEIHRGGDTRIPNFNVETAAEQRLVTRRTKLTLSRHLQDI
jgi:hypothetical protein